MGPHQERPRYQSSPGSLRDFMVDVGKHTRHYCSLPNFLNVSTSFYGEKIFGNRTRLVVIASAHHRYAWITRLATAMAGVIPAPIQRSLNSPRYCRLRPVDRSHAPGSPRQRYYALPGSRRTRTVAATSMAAATSRRRPGRLLRVLPRKPARFDPVHDYYSACPELRTRVERYSSFRPCPSSLSPRSINARGPRVWWIEGEIPRSRVQEITGKAATVSVEIIKRAWKRAILRRPVPKAAARRLPGKIHEF